MTLHHFDDYPLVKNDTLAIMFLRGQPVHRGHELIIKQMMNDNIHHLVVLINGEQSSKKIQINPLPAQTRLNLLNKITQNVIVEKNPYDAIAKLQNQWKYFLLYTGSDRDYSPLFKSLKANYTEFRIPRDIFPMKATDLRSAAKHGYKEVFDGGKPSMVSQEQWNDIFLQMFKTLNRG